MKKIILISILILPFFSQAQDIHFSQFNETPVVINPALSCTAYDTRVIANYRNQWASVTSPYQTYGLSVKKVIKYLKLKKSYIGTSLTVYNDKAGDAGLGTLTAHLGLNAVIKTGVYSKISGGLGGGINYRTINAAKLRWESQYDGYTYNGAIASGEVTPTSSILQADFVGGIVYHYAKSESYMSAKDGTKFDIGFSAFHYNTPKYSFIASGDKQYAKFIGHANFDIGIKNAGIALVPSIIYMRQGPAQEINAGFMFKYIIQDQSVYTNIKKASAISAGVFYRVGDAIIPSLLLQYDKYAFGVSYDLNLSKLSTASKLKGGIELSLRYNTNPAYGKATSGNFNK